MKFIVNTDDTSAAKYPPTVLYQPISAQDREDRRRYASCEDSLRGFAANLSSVQGQAPGAAIIEYTNCGLTADERELASVHVAGVIRTAMSAVILAQFYSAPVVLAGMSMGIAAVGLVKVRQSSAATAGNITNQGNTTKATRGASSHDVLSELTLEGTNRLEEILSRPGKRIPKLAALLARKT